MTKFDQKILNKNVIGKSEIENFGYLREDYIFKEIEFYYISEIDEKNKLKVNYNWLFYIIKNIILIYISKEEI